MEGVPPALREILKQCLQEEIVTCEMSAGSNPGDNVIGKMLSIKLTTKSGEMHNLIVKASIPFRHDHEMELTYDEKMFPKLVNLFGSYQTELAYYQRVQPGMESWAQTKGYCLPTPKFYFGQIDEQAGMKSCLVLEDLRPLGYKMADKMKGLTMDEVIMVLEKLSRFHAASYTYLKSGHLKLKDKYDRLTTHVFDKAPLNKPEFEKLDKGFVNQIYIDMYNLGKKTGVISEEMYEKIAKLTSDAHGTIISYSKRATQEYFPVVVHGDLWINNMLFKYDLQGKPVDAKFIDFQQCRYSSVYDDLHYFFYTSTSTEFRKDNLELCLDFYYEKFQEAIKSLVGNNLEDKVMAEFTREALHCGFRKYLKAAFCYGTCAIPFQQGIPTTAGENAKVDDNGNLEVEIRNDDDAEAELLQFAAKCYKDLTVGLTAAAKNSEEALKRFGEFCKEMDKLTVFND